MTLAIQTTGQINYERDFSRPYLVRLLALICGDPDFLPTFHDLVQPGWFGDSIMADYARMAREYFIRLKTGPTIEATAQAVHDRLKASPILLREQGDAYADLLGELAANTNPPERADIISKLAMFARCQGTLQVVLNGIDDLNEGRPDVFLRRVQQALLMGTDRGKRGLSYFDATAEDFSAFKRDNLLSTGIPELDALLGGGVGVGEPYVVAAPAKRFKTGTLLNLARAAILREHDVVFIPLEMATRAMVSRFHKTFLDVDPHHLSGEALWKLAQGAKERLKIKGKLHIRDWTMRSARVEDLQGYIHRLRMDGQLPCGPGKLLIIVDYPKLLRADARAKNEGHWEQVAELYCDTFALAGEFEAKMFVAAQTNKGSAKKGVVTYDDLSYAWQIAGDAHGIITLSENEEEEEQGIMRMTLVTREGVSDETIKVQVDKAMMKLMGMGAPARVVPGDFRKPVTETPAAARRRA